MSSLSHWMIFLLHVLKGMEHTRSVDMTPFRKNPSVLIDLTLQLRLASSCSLRGLCPYLLTLQPVTAHYVNQIALFYIIFNMKTSYHL